MTVSVDALEARGRLLVVWIEVPVNEFGGGRAIEPRDDHHGDGRHVEPVPGERVDRDPQARVATAVDVIEHIAQRDLLWSQEVLCDRPKGDANQRCGH